MSGFSAPETWADAGPSVVPLVRTTTTPIDALRTDRRLVSRPLGPSLHVVLAWEDERVRLFLRDAHLARWGVRAEVAFATAWSGVEAGAGLTLGDHGVWTVASEDGNASARAALPGFFDAFRGRLRGQPIVAVPHARRLFVAGSDDDDAIAWLVGAAARAWRSEGDPISPCLYVARGGALAPWDGGSPALQAAQRVASLAFLRREYGRIADASEEAWSSFEVAVPGGEGGADEPFGFCRVRGGAIVPRTDVVVFEDARVGAYLAVPFDALVQVLGVRLRPVEAPLPAFRVEPVRDDDIARLRPFAISPERFGG